MATHSETPTPPVIPAIPAIPHTANPDPVAASLESVKQFSAESPVPDIPTAAPEQPTYNGDSLVSNSIEKVICSETVAHILIPETFEINLPNYVIDFSKVSSMHQHQLDALQTILTDDGDTWVYIYVGSRIMLIGKTDSSSIERLLPIGLQSIFSGKCALYKDIDRNTEQREIKKNDYRKVRLRL